MRGEVSAFFNHLVQDDRPLLDLIDCNYTFVNQRLANLYGLTNVAGDEFRMVSLTDARRGGVLGMAGIHALTSFPLRTSPVLRGRWLLEALLGDKACRRP